MNSLNDWSIFRIEKFEQLKLFFLQGKMLLPNAPGGVLISNQSLVLQHVHKEMSGVYTCMAHNIEGDGTSNPMTLNIRCKYEKF